MENSQTGVGEPAEVYRYTVQVGEAHIDRLGHANNVSYVQWMQDAAVAHSRANGWSNQAYESWGAIWVARRHEIKYRQPALPGDTVVVETWVSGMRHASSKRRYEFRRESDQAALASAETDWAMVSLQTRRPMVIPDEIRASFVIVSR